jgi:hypothetical protein
MRGFSEHKTSALVLIAANVLPLFGVLLLGWDTFSIIALYWVENVIIGAINVLKMLACNPHPEEINWSHMKPTYRLYQVGLQSQRSGSDRGVQIANQFAKLFFVPFFVVHYGLFCLVHGAILFAIFGHDSHAFGLSDEIRNFTDVFTAERMWWCIAAIAASHLYSFCVNYIGRGEYRRTIVELQMFQPYGRIVILHIAIILGGFVSMLLGSNVAILMMLIAGKTALDLSLHLSERDRNAGQKSRRTEEIPDVITAVAEESPATPAASER